MRIERVEVVGFGCLERCHLQITPNQANLILAPNEAGKSTLLAAIEVALYGFPSPRTREGRELREQHRPWSGGASRVTLTLCDDSHTYRIEHHVLDATGGPIDRTTVYRDHDNVTDEMHREAASAGEWLFRISRDDFRRSVLVRQGDLEAVAGGTERLVQHLESIATSTEAHRSATAAQDRLDEALEDYRALAGLEHWSQTYLAQAKQWSRVKQRLEQTVDDYQRQRHALTKRREELAREIETIERNRRHLEELTKAREYLSILERAAQRRDLQGELDRDDELISRIDKLQREISGYDDVKAFPAEGKVELTRLLERDSQLRKQLSGLDDKQARVEQQVGERERERAAMASYGVLSDQIDELRAQLTLFTQAVADEKERRKNRERTIEGLETKGCPPGRLQDARQCYRSLTEDERATVRDFELDLSSLKQQRHEAERRVREAQQELDRINEQRHRRRRNGGLLVLGGFTAAVAAMVVLAWSLEWSWEASLFVGSILVSAGCLSGGWLIVSSRQLKAYSHDRLHAEIRGGEEVCARLDGDERRVCDVVDRLAQRQNLGRDHLLETVRFYSSHRDQLEEYEQVDRRWTETQENVHAHQRRWARWLGDVGHDIPAGRVDTEMAASLLEKSGRWNHLSNEQAAMQHSIDMYAREMNGVTESAREVQTAIASLLCRAGVDMPVSAEAHRLVAPEELVAARREFERLADRAALRSGMITELESLRGRKLRDQKRAELSERVKRLDADLSEAGGDSQTAHVRAGRLEGRAHIILAEEVLSQLLDYHEAEALVPQYPMPIPQPAVGNPQSPVPDSPFAHWRLDTLQVEEVASARERLGREMENKQRLFANTWQEARAFLKEYVTRMSQAEGELGRAKAELRRGTRFAEAVGIAKRTLSDVQSDSYQRWSELLADRLRPLLAEFLPNYRLQGISRMLAPTLIHEPTQQTLDLEGIKRHLSRGAKDRLFLAMRLALSQVLSAQRGVCLPLLLDDPMANWDDEALRHGMRILSKLGHTERQATACTNTRIPTNDEPSIVLFSCQRSRFEWTARTAGEAGLDIAAREFLTSDDQLDRGAHPAHGQVDRPLPG